MSSGVGKFVGLLLSSREQAHVFHLLTSSYSVHKAMQEYYEGIVPLVDEYAETYMGKSQRKISGLTPYINRTIVTNPRLVKAYFTKLLNTIRLIKLPKESALDNIQQEIKALIVRTLFLLGLK